MLSGCCFEGLVCPVVRAARPSLCSGSGLARQPFTVGMAFPGRRNPVQGRASALLFWTPHAWWHTVWAWHGTQEILSE